MSVIREVMRGLVGLFIDDEFLAVSILAVVAATAALVLGVGVDPLMAGAALLIGNVTVLVVGATRTAKRRRGA
jgi:membrane protein YqaA with SNARE-associated domain